MISRLSWRPGLFPAQQSCPAASAAPTAQLRGTVSVITGGGRGIGRVLAQALADAGAAVGLIARSGADLAETVRLVEACGGTAAAARADVTDQQAAADAIAALQRQLGPVDLLVNNAGVGGPVGDAWQVNPGDWWRTVEINLRGVFLCSRAVLPAMTARGTGRIVNITSDAGVYRWPQVSAYSVSKAAVIKFTENLAAEANRSGIRAFSVHPGLTPIGLSERALASDAPPGSAQARMHAWVRRELQAGRGAEPALVASLVTRLAAGDADRLSGCHLSVHDDLDAILACGQGVRDRYQLRRAGTPKHSAGLRVIVPPHLPFLARGRTPVNSPFQSGRSDQPSAGSQDRSQRDQRRLLLRLCLLLRRRRGSLPQMRSRRRREDKRDSQDQRE
jgi:NAD(P)-dependent dehydrogenase (short-subunit alcohol dehydrogenase family)